MRNETRLTFGLLLLYLPVALLLGWGLDRSVVQSSNQLLAETAQLIAREVAASVSPEQAAELFARAPTGPPAEPRARAEAIDELLELESELVGLEAVAVDGEVLAADNTARVGQRKASLDSRFGGEAGEVSAVGLESPRAVRVALRVDGEARPLGYLDLTLDLRRQASPFLGVRRRILGVLAASFVAVGLLAFLLHRLAHRSERQLIRSMEEAATGRFASAPPSPQFSRALAAVGRLGEELRTERDRTRRLASLAEFIDVGVLVLDAYGEVELVSQRCRRLLTTEGETGDPETFRLVSWQSLSTQLQPALAALSEAPAGASQEVVVELEGEEPRRTRQVQVVALEEGEGFLCLVRDRDMLESLRTDLRLAAYLRGLTRLYMGIAHDLKGPLNAVHLHLEVLRRAALREAGSPEAEEKIEAPLSTIRSELKRLGTMIESLLSQTAPPSDQLESFDLAALLAEIEGMLAPQARRQRVSLGVEIEDAPLTVRTHRDQLKQAILNVAINGLEVLDQGGALRVEAGRRDGRIQVRVRDSGPGIAPEVRDRLFEMHVTTKETGTGIGLWVVRSTLEARGGSIEVESSGPDGTTFLLELPASTDR